MVRTDILKRTRKTIPQVAMHDKTERLHNMEGAFSVQTDTKLPSRVILFDDVFTTGTTMRAATNTLKRHGVSFVWAVTMAR